MKWNLQPFAIATPALILGILSDSILNTSRLAIFCSVLFFIIILSISTVVLKQHKSKTTLSLSIILGFLMLGYLSSQRFWLANKPNIGRPELESVSVFTAIVISKPDRTANSLRYKVLIKNIKNEHNWSELDEEAIMYAGGEKIYKYGDMLMIKSNPYLLERQKNPHAFDYTLYLQRKGIFFQAYSDATNTVLLKEDQLRDFEYWTLRMGDIFERMLARFIHRDRELNIARAMILGRRNEITPEMEYVYESTGTSHILAVSGLHVGIIFLIISRLLKPLKSRKGLKWIYYSVIIVSIWAFAVLTGLSPSVKRAALMFTFIMIAEMLNRNHNIYNTLLASAFCILLVTPTLIYSVSFQFSYMAVLGIVFLFKKIYRLIFVENRLLDFFWQITALSFSVQIATFAINIHYFNHFPVLFPITNLFAIPVAMAVVLGSLIIFFTSFIPAVPNILGFILQSCIWFYNEIMIVLSNREITSIEGLTLKTPYVLLLILLAFTLTLFLLS
jgi:competence protein ComEC